MRNVAIMCIFILCKALQCCRRHSHKALMGRKNLMTFSVAAHFTGGSPLLGLNKTDQDSYKTNSTLRSSGVLPIMSSPTADIKHN